MRWRAARRAAAVGVGLILLAACTKGTPKAESPGATLGTAAPTTTTTNPYAVPPVIDAAYVNRVLAGLDEVEGQAVRIVVKEKALPRAAFDRLKAIYASPDRLQLELDSLQLAIQDGLKNYKTDPGTRTTIVQRLISATRSCVFAQVQRDYSAIGLTPGPPGTEWVGIKPLDSSMDPSGYNLTSWALIYDGFPRDRSQPPDPCVAS